MSKSALSRRTLLRGSVAGIGVAVGLPMLDAMLRPNGDALAAGGALPKRFGSFFWGNGVVMDRWLPTQTGASWQLSPLLMPLANVKDYCSIVSGTVVYVPYQVPGHFGALQAITSGVLGTAQGGLNYAYAGKTMDVLIAEKIGTSTRFRALHLGVASTDASDADFGAVARSISHNGPNSPNLPEFDPIALYDRVFGDGFTGGGSTPPVSSKTIGIRKSVLDLVRQDTVALQGRLGQRDKERLDQHLQGVRDLEMQLTEMPNNNAPGCNAPSRPTSSYPARDGQEIQWEPLTAVQIELLAMALICDQTRVFTFRFSPCNDFTVYPGFPKFQIDPNDTNTGTSMHGLTHTEGGDQPGVQKCVTFSMSKLAALLERLLAAKEGDGSVLDNCGIFAFSEHSEGRSHSSQDQPGLPIIVAGRAGGRLVHPGIHYKSPLKGDATGENNGRNVGVVPLTLMQALDTGITSWGAGKGLATKVIDELLV